MTMENHHYWQEIRLQVIVSSIVMLVFGAVVYMFSHFAIGNEGKYKDVWKKMKFAL